MALGQNNIKHIITLLAYNSVINSFISFPIHITDQVDGEDQVDKIAKLNYAPKLYAVIVKCDR